MKIYNSSSLEIGQVLLATVNENVLRLYWEVMGIQDSTQSECNFDFLIFSNIIIGIKSEYLHISIYL